MPRIITIFRQVCDALTYVHLRGVVHGLVSSHAIQLVTVNYAKIGNFEYAVDRYAASVNEMIAHLFLTYFISK